MARFRPMNAKEKAMEKGPCVNFPNDQTIVLTPSAGCEGGQKHTFYFDKVFDTNSHQRDIYEFAARPVVDSVLDGFNGTIFAYGQTSSGKTYTMQGYDIHHPDLAGIVPRMVQHIFASVRASPDNIEFELKLSIVEIYLEKIKDLLDTTKINLKVREDPHRGIHIEDVTECFITDEKEVYDYIEKANHNRSVAFTNMNEGSSRSHLLFMLSIHQIDKHSYAAKTGKLFLVDLAGSEKIAKTGAEGQTLKEAQQINKSLSCLGNVINALTDGKSQHIPYRDSKLTRVMTESLGGNARTSLIITCSPSIFNDAETLSTLRFGTRAKAIKNKPKINRELTVGELQKMLEAAELEMNKKTQRITQLESFIKENGLSVPAALYGTSAAPKKPNEKEERTNEKENSDDEDSGPETSVSVSAVANEAQEERIRILESELKQEKSNLNLHSEKLKLLRSEFSLINGRMIKAEKENSLYLDKITELTLEKQRLEESASEKDIELKFYSNLNDSHQNEMMTMRNSVQIYQERLEQKEEELEELRKQYRMLGVTGKMGPSDKAKVMSSTALLQEIEKEETEEKKELVSLKEGLSQDMERITELQKLMEGEISPEEMAKIQKQQNDLLRESLEKMKSQVEMLEKQNSKDKLKEALAGSQMFEKDKALLQEKVTDLQNQLKEEKNKNNNMLNSRQDNEKNLIKRIQMLEKNLENMSVLYNKEMLAKGRMVKENEKTEKKLQRREDKIKKLEGSVKEYKAKVADYKIKCETLATVMGQQGNPRKFINELMQGPQSKEMTAMDRPSTAISSTSGVETNPGTPGLMGPMTIPSLASKTGIDPTLTKVRKTIKGGGSSAASKPFVLKTHLSFA